jgi:hypothetical protein
LDPGFVLSGITAPTVALLMSAAPAAGVDAAPSAANLRSTPDRLLGEAWPSPTAAALLGSAIAPAQPSPPVVTVVHNADPLEPASAELLGSALSARLNFQVSFSSLAA